MGRWSTQAMASWSTWSCAVSHRRRCVRLRSTSRNFAMFLHERGLVLAEIVPTDLFGYLDWQSRRPGAGGKVVPIGRTTTSPATLNRRISAVRGLFEHLVTTGARADNPVSAARRASGLRSQHRGLLGHLTKSEGDPPRFPASCGPQLPLSLFLHVTSVGCPSLRRDKTRAEGCGL